MARGCSDCSSNAVIPPTNMAESPWTARIGLPSANSRSPGAPITPRRAAPSGPATRSKIAPAILARTRSTPPTVPTGPFSQIRDGCAAGCAAVPASCGWRRSDQLEDGGVGLAAAFTPRLAAVTGAGGAHVVHQGGHDPGAAAAERVTEGDGAAVGVEPGRVGAGLGEPGERHGGEGLVDFEGADVADRQAAALQGLGGGGDRA